MDTLTLRFGSGLSLGLVLILVLLAGCTFPDQSTTREPRPTATISPIFRDNPQQLPTIILPTPLPRATSLAEPTSSSGVVTLPRDPLDRVIEEIPIFDERLAPDWTTIHSFDLNLNLQSPITASSGFTAIEAVPRAPFGGIMLTLLPEATTQWPRSRVVGVRFDVSGGQTVLAPHNLIVSVLGSNRYPYYVEGDDSVPRPPGMRAFDPVFDQVNLTALGLQRDLRPNEWAEVTLWLDEYDLTDYRFVTSLVIFNDEFFLRPFYVDNVRLLVLR